MYKTLHSEKPFPSLLALGAIGFSHPAQLLELVISSVCSTYILSPTTSASACPAPLCCDFYFVELRLINDHLLLHLYVLKELQCLVGCKVEWTSQALALGQDSVKEDTGGSRAVSRV